MTDIDLAKFPSYRGIGAPRYTVEDFAEQEPQTDLWGWGCRVATVVMISFAIIVGGLGIPLAGLILLGVCGSTVGATAILRDGLAWAWLPSRRGGVVALVGSVSVLVVASSSGVPGLDALALWEPAAALTR